MATMVGCQRCGRTIALDAAACPHCGVGTGREAEPTGDVPVPRPPRAFTVEPIPKAGLLGRMVGRYPREAAFAELRNLLATTPFPQVRESDVASILARAKLLPRDAVTDLVTIFEHAAQLLSVDRVLDDTDREGLAALRRAFELTEAEADAAIERAVGYVFESTMTEALADGRFTPDERARLENTAKGLGMDEALTTRLYAAAATGAVQRVFARAIADRRFTGGEEEALRDLAGALGVTLTFDKGTQALIARARAFGQIEDGELPEVSTAILLQRGERCHFSAEAVTHKEMRTVTKRVNYSGPTASIRLMKGVRWRVGSIAVQPVREDVLLAVDTGDLHITSKKVLFQGTRKNTAISLGKVVHFTVFNDGLQVEKETGKDLYAVGQADWEMAGACLEGAIRAAR